MARLWVLSLVVAVLALGVSAQQVQSAPPVYALQNLNKTPSGLTAQLVLQSGSGPYGADIKTLDLLVEYQTQSRLHVKISAPDRWQVPPSFIQHHHHTDPPVPIPPEQLEYALSISENPFSFAVHRKSGTTLGEQLWNTTDQPFVFSEQYLSIGTSTVKNPNIYGLGERVHNLRLDPSGSVNVMWNADKGNTPDTNLYGTHPFYLELRTAGACSSAHGVFLLNSNAMDVRIGPSETILWETIGGVFDFYFFMGPTPEEVTRQYHRLVGFPYMPPYWALGWHQCRWGYEDIQQVRDVVSNYSHFGIPLDTQWTDIDYMRGYRVFTLDPVRFPTQEMQAFVAELHSRHQQFVPIVDPGVKIDPDFDAYISLNQSGMFIRGPDGKSALVGKVWPGFTIFPDFSHSDIDNYWAKQIELFYMNGIPFDGLWIDMNEIANFCNGPCDDAPSTADATVSSSKRQLSGFDPNNPPYLPGDERLEFHGIAPDSWTSHGLYYDSHDLYGTLETNSTRRALEKIRGKRALVVSRSTFSGQGHIGAHWLGDNESTWKSMFLSISGMLAFNMFGVPLVGADVCGFNGDTTEQLCTRWMELGSLYPFARNHNSKDQRPQEPYVFGTKLAAISRNVLLNRYSLLPFYYTLFFRAHTQGGTVMRPLFFEFPSDKSGFIPYIDRQFLVGPSLMASPVLDQDATSVSAYFPSGIWYDYYTGKAINGDQQFVTLDAPIDFLPLHVRGGFIIPKHMNPQLTTWETRQQPFELLVALNTTGHAGGELFVDDGESLTSISSRQYLHTEYQASSTQTTGNLSSRILANSYPPANLMKLGRITVYGAPDRVCAVNVNGRPTLDFVFSAENRVLKVNNINTPITQQLSVVWTSQC